MNRRMYYKQRRSVLLLELIIAMSLAIIILSTLSVFYYQISMINIEMDKQQNDSFQKRYIENRLSAILPAAIKAKDASKDFHFFTTTDQEGLFKQGTPSLVFSFDNGVQTDKMMSYHVIGRLFLDPEGHLTLAKWPAEKRWKGSEKPPLSKEILLENVDSLSFSFYAQPDKRKIQSKEKQKAPDVPAEMRGRWQASWNKEYHQLPAIVKIDITRKNYRNEEEKLSYAFPLPLTAIPITYSE